MLRKEKKGTYQRLIGQYSALLQGQLECNGSKRFRIIRASMNRQNGFTLVEVLGAIVILSIVSLVLTSYFANAMTYSKSNQNKTIMVNLARNALFYMEKQDFEKMQEFFVTESYTLSASTCEIGTCGDNSSAEGKAYQKAFETEALAHVLHPKVNGIEYSIDVFYQDGLLEEPDSGVETVNEVAKTDIKDYLLPVKVVVTRDSGDGPSAPVRVEGYISNEEIR